MKNQSKIFIFFCVVLMQIALINCQDQRRTTSNTCKIDSDCPDNAFCRLVDDSGYCNCKTNFILHPWNNTHRQCLREADRLGDPCQIDVQCNSKLSPNSECVNNACQCKSGSHFDEGRCYQTSIIGQRCVVNQNCYLGPDDISTNQAFCVRGICECNLLHSPRDGGTRCLKDAVLGDQCEDNEHCTGENTMCDGVCRCADGYVVHPNEQRCMKAASAMYAECEIDAQCTKNLNGTFCYNMKCDCDWERHAVGGRCWLTRSLGQRCNSDQECLTDKKEQGQCLDGSCTCQGCKPYRNNSSILQPKIAYTILSIVSILLSVVKSL